MLKTKDDKFFEYEIIGEFQSDGVWIHPTRRIDSYEMIFVIDGTVFIEEDGAEYELNTNDVLILEPGRLHGGTRESTSPTSFYWFHFRTDMEIPGKTYSSGEYYDLKYLLKKLLHITNSHTYPPETADALGLCAFCEYTNMVEKAAAGNNALLGKIDEYIRINVQKDIPVAAVAGHFGYNADYIGRMFKKNHGVGLKQYIAAERVKAAKDLLLTTGLSVKEIAAKLGFREENLFIKFFIYHEEISPTRFRNKYVGVHINNK